MRLRNTGTTITFRADLPAWLEPTGAAFIEVTARPMGRVNSAYMAARETAMLAYQIEAGEDAEPAAKLAATKRLGMAMMAAVYDACVVSWSVNLINDETGEALQADRDTFLELADTKITEIGKAFLDLQNALLEAGAKVLADTEATIKN